MVWRAALCRVVCVLSIRCVVVVVACCFVFPCCRTFSRGTVDTVQTARHGTRRKGTQQRREGGRNEREPSDRARRESSDQGWVRRCSNRLFVSCCLFRSCVRQSVVSFGLFWLAIQRVSQERHATKQHNNNNNDERTYETNKQEWKKKKERGERTKGKGRARRKLGARSEVRGSKRGA